MNKENNIYEKLTFTNDFIFCKVMQNNEKLCKELVELIIGKKVGRIVKNEKQKAVENTPDGRGIRFDIYLEDEKKIYNVEMQNYQHDNICKRARYYQSMLDVDFLQRGEHYSDLKDSYIIFINDFDIFAKGLPKYTFKNKCVEIPTLEMDDGTIKIFVNIKGKYDKIKPKMKAFLNYLNSGRATDNFTEKLDSEVALAKNNPHWRDEFMTLYEHYQMERYEGLTEGRMKGRKEGIVEGRKEGIVEGRKEGIVEGRKEGIEEGRKEGILNCINNALNLSYSLEEACKIAGISLEEYNKIK